METMTRVKRRMKEIVNLIDREAPTEKTFLQCVGCLIEVYARKKLDSQGAFYAVAFSNMQRFQEDFAGLLSDYPVNHPNMVWALAVLSDGKGIRKRLPGCSNVVNFQTWKNKRRE